MHFSKFCILQRNGADAVHAINETHADADTELTLADAVSSAAHAGLLTLWWGDFETKFDHVR